MVRKNNRRGPAYDLRMYAVLHTKDELSGLVQRLSERGEVDDAQLAERAVKTLCDMDVATRQIYILQLDNYDVSVFEQRMRAATEFENISDFVGISATYATTILTRIADSFLPTGTNRSGVCNTIRRAVDSFTFVPGSSRISVQFRFRGEGWRELNAGETPVPDPNIAPAPRNPVARNGIVMVANEIDRIRAAFNINLRNPVLPVEFELRAGGAPRVE